MTSIWVISLGHLEEPGTSNFCLVENVGNTFAKGRVLMNNEATN